jgi:hypothetical protein
MYQHETPKKLLAILDKSLSNAHNEIPEWKTKLVTSQKYEEAKQFNELDQAIVGLWERVSVMLRVDNYNII